MPMGFNETVRAMESRKRRREKGKGAAGLAVADEDEDDDEDIAGLFPTVPRKRAWWCGGRFGKCGPFEAAWPGRADA